MSFNSPKNAATAGSAALALGKKLGSQLPAPSPGLRPWEVALGGEALASEEQGQVQACWCRGSGEQGSELTFQGKGGAAWDPGQRQLLRALHAGGVLPDSRRVVTCKAKERVRPHWSARSQRQGGQSQDKAIPVTVQSSNPGGCWAHSSSANQSCPSELGSAAPCPPRRPMATAHLSPCPLPPGIPSCPLHCSSSHHCTRSFLHTAGSLLPWLFAQTRPGVCPMHPPLSANPCVGLQCQLPHHLPKSV